MARWTMRWQCAGRRLAVVALVGVLGLTGCGKKDAVPSEQAEKPPEGTPAVATNTGASTGTPAGTDTLPPPPQDGQHEPFAKATRGGDDPPADSGPPPDITASGKSVYKIYKEVVRLWDTIRFVTPDGKPIHYSATVETDMGTIEIALRPDLAPNHVRNFVALARAGYYDELFVDRICHEENEGNEPEKVVFDSIEVGCPRGTGERGSGSIGYWLKPEFTTKATHEEGTVGACHGNEADTAACRFYITLCNAPFLDGNFTVFGKVTRGLDVARTITKQPTREYEDDVAGSLRPDKPIKIKKVTIHTSEMEAGH